MKMYLYDLTILGIIRKDIQEKIAVKRTMRFSLGRKREFDRTPYRTYEEDMESYVYTYVITLVVVLILLIVCVFRNGWIYSGMNAVLTILRYGFGDTIAIILVGGCYLASPLIPIYYKKQKHKQEEREKQVAEQKAREVFEKEEDRRLQRESRQIVQLNNEIKMLEEKYNKIDTEIKRQFNMNILHEKYQDVTVCGVMFQLFDTGRVQNLTDAMNLYEDLKWKSGVNSMLQTLIDKVDALLDRGENMEYYSKCMIQNQQEMSRILQDVAMNQEKIQNSQEAIEINTDIIRFNTDTVKLLETYRLLEN